MNIKLSVRAFVRIITFIIAIFLILLSFALINKSKHKNTVTALNNTCLRAVTELSMTTNNIKTTLTKTVYSSSPEMLNELASKLWRDSSLAKSSLAQLPLGDVNLDKTNTFLSQVGNFAISLAEKAGNNEKLSQEDYDSLKKLCDFSNSLSSEIWEFENRIQNNTINIVDGFESASFATEKAPCVYEGFVNFEEGFENYPTLIYDGPFSDHILEKESSMLKKYNKIDEECALNRASEVTGIEAKNLSLVSTENSKIPSYTFSDGNTYVSVTQNGGIISYLLRTRNVQDRILSIDDSLSTAETFLLSQGITGFEKTYYETYNNICTVNFAKSQNDVTIYPELIKISIAMDNGEITGYDSRGYIINHTERNIQSPKISNLDASNVISEHLKIKNVKLAIIPTEGQNEIYAYEFNCLSDDGTKVIVYINADTKKEEQILIVSETCGGIFAE